MGLTNNEISHFRGPVQKPVPDVPSSPGSSAVTELNRVFFTQLNILGSTMGTRDELERLTSFLIETGIRPTLDSVLPLGDAVKGFARMLGGSPLGKIVFTH